MIVLVVTPKQQAPKPAEASAAKESLAEVQSKETSLPQPLEVMPSRMAKFVSDMKAKIVDTTSMISPQDQSGQKATFVIWDFGGQQLYYTMHQTFLSRTAFYLIVMDISKGLDEVIDTASQHPMWKDSGSPKTSRGELPG